MNLIDLSMKYALNLIHFLMYQSYESILPELLQQSYFPVRPLLQLYQRQQLHYPRSLLRQLLLHSHRSRHFYQYESELESDPDAPSMQLHDLTLLKLHYGQAELHHQW